MKPHDHTLFSPEVDLAALQDDLLCSLQLKSLPHHEIQVLADRDWEREWLRDLTPLKFGNRLWVCPERSTADDPDAVIVHLDPGLAFGTGTHPTTALCLEWLDSLVLEGTSMLDVGCGSGILAIAALRLGCRHAVAYDIDPQAITATRMNAERNGVGEHLTVTVEAPEVKPEYDVVVANILARPLIETATTLCSYLKRGSLLALSGILSSQVDDVRAAYGRWIDFDAPVAREQGGQTWVRLTGQRIEG